MNIYTSPEKFGMTLIAERNFAGGYEFDQVLVLRDKWGALFVAHDAGCSCPTPFEFTGVSDLVPVCTVSEIRNFTVNNVCDYNLSGHALVDWVDTVRSKIEVGS